MTVVFIGLKLKYHISSYLGALLRPLVQCLSLLVGWLVGGLLLAAMFVVNEPLTLVVLQEHTTDLSAAQPEV